MSLTRRVHMSEKTGEPRKKHHEIMTWDHISDSPRRRVAPTPPDHLPYMFLAGTDHEDYKRGLPPPLTRHTISYVNEKSREASPLCIISLGSV